MNSYIKRSLNNNFNVCKMRYYNNVKNYYLLRNITCIKTLI